MRTALRITAGLALVVALVVAVVALVQLHSTRGDLDRTEHRLAAVQSKLSNVAAADTARAGHEPALNAALDRLDQLEQTVGDLKATDPCDPDYVSTYYQRLQGAADVGADVQDMLNILAVICPNSIAHGG